MDDAPQWGPRSFWDSIGSSGRNLVPSAASSNSSRNTITVVKVEFCSPEVDQVTCRMQTGSWLQFSTSHDQKRLAEQIDLLEACLKGALSYLGAVRETGRRTNG